MNALFHCNSSTSLSIQSLLSRANTVAKEWGGKLSSTDEITVNTVTPKCEELVRLHDLCTESLKYKQMLADKQSTLYVHIDAVSIDLHSTYTLILSTSVNLQTQLLLKRECLGGHRNL